MDVSTSDRRVAIEHENSIIQIVGVWPADQSVPATLNVRDEEDRPRVVRLMSVNERYIRYRTEPLGTPVAAPEL